MTTTATHPAFAMVFPGQGAQAIGMMSELAARFPSVRARFGEASEVLGYDLWALVEEGPEDELNRTERTQPALLAASVATWDVWCALGGPRPRLMAGHSFGEYSALVCAGVLDFAAAVELVAARGRFMQEAVPAGTGAMAAILGLDFEPLAALCAEASVDGEQCACANLNAPGQIVVAGTAAAVDRVCEAARGAGAKRAMRLAVSVPAHCALMVPAARRLAERLATTTLGPPRIEVLHNVDVGTHTDPAGIRDVLTRQLHSPVRWIETIETFGRTGIRHVGECGPGKVLATLIKRIDREQQVVSLGNAADCETLLAALAGVPHE